MLHRGAAGRCMSRGPVTAPPGLAERGAKVLWHVGCEVQGVVGNGASTSYMCAVLLGSVTRLCRQTEHTCLQQKSAPAFCPKSCW